jgi:hypothetical protein
MRRMFRASPVFLLILSACESAGGSLRQRSPDAMLQLSELDLALPPHSDLSEPIERDFSALSQTDLMPGVRHDLAGAAPTGCTPVVNELLLSTFKAGTTTSRPNEEFVELYNSCTTSINLKGWSLRYRSAQNNQSVSNADTTLVTDINKTIAAGGYLLYTGTQYGGTGDGALLGGLSDNGGGVALVDGNGNIVDSVAYGTAIASHNFLEGKVAPAPPQVTQPGKTIARTPNGHDSDDNSADFVVASPTPKAAN